MERICYDFCGISTEILSPLPIPDPSEPFLKDTDASKLKITLTTCNNLPQPEGMLLGKTGDAEIWRQGSEITRLSRDRFRPMAHMSVSYDLENWSCVHALVRREYWAWAAGSRYLWTGLGLPQLLLHAGVLLFHASYIGFRGQGILFVAPSGTGKSTQAELWRRCRGAEIINGDKAAVRLGIACMSCSVPFSGTSGICRNLSLPLKAVVVLSQAPENTVRRLAPAEAAGALGSNMFTERIVSEEWSMALNCLLSLVSSVPVYALSCTPDERAVSALEHVL